MARGKGKSDAQKALEARIRVLNTRQTGPVTTFDPALEVEAVYEGAVAAIQDTELEEVISTAEAMDHELRGRLLEAFAEHHDPRMSHSAWLEHVAGLKAVYDLGRADGWDAAHDAEGQAS